MAAYAAQAAEKETAEIRAAEGCTPLIELYHQWKPGEQREMFLEALRHQDLSIVSVPTHGKNKAEVDAYRDAHYVELGHVDPTGKLYTAKEFMALLTTAESDCCQSTDRYFLCILEPIKEYKSTSPQRAQFEGEVRITWVVWLFWKRDWVQLGWH